MCDFCVSASVCGDFKLPRRSHGVLVLLMLISMYLWSAEEAHVYAGHGDVGLMICTCD